MSKGMQLYYRRRMIQRVGRALQTIFTRTTVSGREYIPPRGPYIAVGNHVAAIETALLVFNLPHVPELIGNGDVPLDPTFGFMAKMYGFIPIRRGEVDRGALRAAQSVLETGNVLGVFPEGGIWDRSARAARPGVAWLSQQTGAPILPIGFGGVIGALGKAWRLKRPRLSMTIGPLMPPVPNPTSPRARKEAIEEASREMMLRIQALVPPADISKDGDIVEERYCFRAEITAPDGSAIPLPGELTLIHGEDLAFYFHRYILLEVIYRNYKLTGAQPLSRYTELDDPAQLGAALDVALDFYTHNPTFLGYRLGYARAGRVVEGLQALRRALAWAEAQNYRMRLIPERTIIRAGGLIQTFIAPTDKREY